MRNLLSSLFMDHVRSTMVHRRDISTRWCTRINFMVRGMSPVAKQVFVLLFCLGEGGTPVLPGIKTRWGDPWKDQPWGTAKEGDPRLGRGPCPSPQGIGTGEGAKSVYLSLRMLMAGCLVWFIGFVKVRNYTVSVQLLSLASKGVCLPTQWGGTPPSGPRSLLFWGGGTRVPYSFPGLLSQVLSGKGGGVIPVPARRCTPGQEVYSSPGWRKGTPGQWYPPPPPGQDSRDSFLPTSRQTTRQNWPLDVWT